MESIPSIARYHILSAVGQGGMGIVYRAQDRLTHEMVALKQVHVAPAQLHLSVGSIDPLLSLAREFRILASLRHPHIIAVLDYGFDQERRPYYTMPLLEQPRTLIEAAEDLPASDKARLVTETLQALVYLHRRGILHRDLKPGNVLVTPEGHVRVVDFGLARAHSAEALAEDAGIVGTLAYIAPEILLGEAASVSSDLFAVGVMLYEVLAGKHPFEDSNATAMLAKVLHGEPDFALVPPAYVPLLKMLLAKTDAERPASAEEAIQLLAEAAGLPTPTESLQLRESFLQASVFVGRNAELALLRQALDAALQGQASSWLLGGESGVGKSRLLDELRPYALIGGALVLRGQAVAEGGLPYQVWRDVARRLALDTPMSDLELGVMKELVPDLERLLGRAIADASPLAGAESQQRLVQTLLALLKRQTQPVVLLLEDLHWAEESLAPLRQLFATQEQFSKLLVVGTFRADERPKLPEELGGTQVLRLERLSTEAITQLAGAMLGTSGQQTEVINLLQRETEGNVFFMVETVRALAEDAGSLASIGQRALPSSVVAGGIQRLIQRRLDRLPAPYQPLLQRAAVAGRALDVRVLAHLAEGVPLDAFLAEGAEIGLFEVAEGTWRFNHDKLREVVLNSLSATERRDLSRLVAQALEASYPEDAAYFEVLMDYWRVAEDSEQELRYLMPVAQLADRRSELVKGQTLAERGLSLLSATDPRRITLLNTLCNALDSQGQSAEGRVFAEEALLLAQQRSDALAIAASLVARGASYLGSSDFASAQRDLEAALATYRQHDDEARVIDILNLIGMIAGMQGNFAAAQGWFEQGWVMAEASGQTHLQTGVLNNLGLVMHYQGDLKAGRDFYQRSLASAQATGRLQATANALNNLGEIANQEGDYAAAADYYQQALALFITMGDKRGQSFPLLNLGSIARKQGDYASATLYFEQSLAIAKQINERFNQGDALLAMAALQFEQGLASALPTLREALTISLDINAAPFMLEMLALLGRMRAKAGDMAQAAALAVLVDKHPALTAHARSDQLEPLQAALGAAALAQAASAPPADLNETVQRLLADDSVWQVG